MTNLRILGGELRGRSLAVASTVRPTAARVREALFSIWQDRVPGCRFLDLFAGSGAVGLEAVSRGAAQALFVDSDPRSLAALRRNCRLAPEVTESRRLRLPAALGHQPDGRFDLIFADPPYGFSDHERLLTGAAGWLAGEGEMAIEHSTRRQVSAAGPWVAADQRSYGDSCLSFFQIR